MPYIVQPSHVCHMPRKHQPISIALTLIHLPTISFAFFSVDPISEVFANDLYYLFYGILSYRLNQYSPEYQTIEHLVGLWTAFATCGDPNFAQTAPVNWKPLEPNSSQMCLNIGTRLQFVELSEAKELKLWDSFHDKVKLY